MEPLCSNIGASQDILTKGIHLFLTGRVTIPRESQYSAKPAQNGGGGWSRATPLGLSNGLKNHTKKWSQSAGRTQASELLSDLIAIRSSDNLGANFDLSWQTS